MYRTIATLFLWAICCTTISAAKPNLLLIVADDMGYGDLSCYGSQQIQTPNLDRLASGGVRCTNGYVSGSVCAPSRAGLMTGRYGGRFGFEHNLSHPEGLEDEFAGIPLDEILLPQRLKEQGYRTGLIGKWHLGESVAGHHPLERGFDFFFGMLGGSHAYFPTVEKNRLLFNHEAPQEIRTPYLTDWFTLEAIDFIQAEGKAKGMNGEQPWFLYLSYNTPHGPMQAKAEDIEQYAHIHNKTRQIYCAMQACMDQNIGKIIDSLESTGQLENTLIAFISDNGGSVEVSHAVNAPLRGTKGTFLEGGIRVPTIYHWPARLPRGKVYDKPVISLDVMNTFVIAAGGKVPSAGETEPRTGRGKNNLPIYDGVDLVPHFRGETKEAPHDTLYWRMALRGAAIREGDWKLLLPASQLPQLYNLKDDIGETTNLIQDQPETAARLLGKLVRWEGTLERNPLFISDPNWSQYNKRLYDKTFSLEQPLPDSEEDIWSF
ncbi:arylsulfatase [Blastopirellula marina]|uniref:Arylsulfatase n=2 Tax=Pirellulales TaxID=2691354 RepID=A0A2S8G4M7_9BACT|nr:arylsulfatase [Blastopirellula marina]RCS55714.1 arylsulfatase [Bremerella cremea]